MSLLPLVYRPFGDEFVLRSIDWLENYPWRQENVVRTEKDKYEIVIQVKDFGPDDISVKTSNGYVEIEAQHEERKDDHGFISRRLTRRFELPSDCRPDDVISTLSSDGILTVTAPRQVLVRNNTVIPVTHDSSNFKSKL
ncbi:protein lethal(2)essential for life-like [Achroia grisella]|uniref:protein lethal(2)essential for life-like n=1 Tax=Achroia grisella TaxID=688607 RepID=UPI0027D2ADBD|nr:protein lethal(2)essential for life-like [Achroia grisella]